MGIASMLQIVARLLQNSGLTHLAVCLSLLMVAGFASAQEQESDALVTLRAKLTQSLVVASGNQLEILSIGPTPLPSVMEIELNTGEILYSDINGDYLFAGDMFQSGEQGLSNLTSAKRQLRTVAKVNAVPEQEMIIFTPEDEVKATISVFTDVDCTYCRALHRDMETLLERGIRIRYLAYPRGGVAAESLTKMMSVWCSSDRQKSLTQAKNGQNIPQQECESPVMEHYDLGNELGISGTPAIVLPDGTLIPGYMDADRLTAVVFQSQ